MTASATPAKPGTPIQKPAGPTHPPARPIHRTPKQPPAKPGDHWDDVFDLLVAEIRTSLRRLNAQGVDGRALLAARLAALGGEGASFRLPVTPRFSMSEGRHRLVGAVGDKPPPGDPPKPPPVPAAAYPDGSPIPPGTPPTPPPPSPLTTRFPAGEEPTPGSADALCGASRESDGAVVAPVAGTYFSFAGGSR